MNHHAGRVQITHTHTSGGFVLPPCPSRRDEEAPRKKLSTSLTVMNVTAWAYALVAVAHQIAA